MTTIARTINHHLAQIADLTASGDATAAEDVVDDLGDTIVALVLAQSRYPKDTKVDGVEVGGQFMPGKGGAGGGSGTKGKQTGGSVNDSDDQDLYDKIMSSMGSEAIQGSRVFTFFMASYLAVNTTVAGAMRLKKFVNEFSRQFLDIPENANLLANGLDKYEPDWNTSEREKGNTVLAEAGVNASVDDLAQSMYGHREKGIPKSATNMLSVLPRRRAAINLLKRRDEIGYLQARLDNEKPGARKELLQKQIDWRVGMIKAEERFGQYVNECYFQNDSGYDGLMKEIKKNSKGKKFNPPKLLKIGGFPGLLFAAALDPEDATTKKLLGFAEELDSMTNADLSYIEVGIEFSGRPFYHKNVAGEGEEKNRGFVSVGFDQYGKFTEIGTPAYRAVLLHELTHGIEDTKGTWETSAQFIKDRDAETGNGLRDLHEASAAYPVGDKSYWDRFYNPYAGKIYEPTEIESGNTEVVSMAIQRLAGKGPLADITNRDREQLMYALSVISK